MEKQLNGKIVDKILGFADFVKDYESWYDSQTKRSGYIVGNGRVPYWLDQDDVDKICKEQELTPRQIIGVRQEFDDERLSSIWDHHCEAESDYYTDWLSGCAFDDYRERTRLYSRYRMYQDPTCVSCELESSFPILKNREVVGHKYHSRLKHYKTEFQDYFSKGMTRDDVWKLYQKQHTEEIKMLDYLNVLDNDPKQTWGGKYPSIVKERTACLQEDDEVLTLIDCIEYAQGNSTTNRTFYKAIFSRCQDWFGSYAFECVKDITTFIDERVSDMNQMRDAVEFVHSYIAGVVEYFEDGLKERLADEIYQFVQEDFNLEERIKEGLAKINSLKVESGGVVVTDMLARAELSRVKEIISKFKEGFKVEGEFIGSYKIREVFTIDGESYFKIGCHLFKLSDVEKSLAA